METWEFEKISNLLNKHKMLSSVKVSTFRAISFSVTLKKEGFTELKHYKQKYREYHSFRRGNLHFIIEKNKYMKISVHRDMMTDLGHMAEELTNEQVRYIINLIKNFG